jgi:hypothetical protein
MDFANFWLFPEAGGRGLFVRITDFVLYFTIGCDRIPQFLPNRKEHTKCNVKIVLTALAVEFLALTSSGVRGAGTDAAEEAAIRKQIAAYDAGSSGSGSRRALVLPDEVFWSGAYKRPIVRPAVSEPVDREGSVPTRVPGPQKAKTQVIRIVVADSHDLACEYSTVRKRWSLT